MHGMSPRGECICHATIETVQWLRVRQWCIPLCEECGGKICQNGINAPVLIKVLAEE